MPVVPLPYEGEVVFAPTNLLPAHHPVVARAARPPTTPAQPEVGDCITVFAAQVHQLLAGADFGLVRHVHTRCSSLLRVGPPGLLERHPETGLGSG